MSKTGDLRVDSIMPQLFKSWDTLPFEECLLDRAVSYKKLKKKDIKQIGKIPVVDQGENFISGYTDNESNAYAGTLPVIVFGDHTRRVKYIDIKFAVGADGTKLLHPFKALYPKFFFFYLSTLKLESQGYSRHYRFLKQINIPIPPLNEQRRIVAKLEKLLGKVDACKERLERIPTILKRFRQSVLSAACSGRLTADWREKNPDVEPASELLKRIKKTEDLYIEDSELLTTWIITKLQSLIYNLQNGISKRKSDSGTNIVVLRLADIEQGKISSTNLREIKQTKEEIKKYKLNPNDILIIRVNGSAQIVGNFILYERSDTWTYCDHFIRMIINPSLIHPKFLVYVSQSIKVREYINFTMVSSAGQNTISQSTISTIPIPLPPLLEQQEIVRRVEALFKVAAQIEERYKKAKTYVNKLTQSILAKAFRGELVPQDPDDGPASVLLERIREELAKQQRKSQTRKTKARRRQRQNQLDINM